MSKKWIYILCFIFAMVTTVVWAKPDSAYIDNENGTVTDIETRLMWQRETADRMSWFSAMSYCSGLSLAGYTDWRLPKMGELMGLWYGRQMPPFINHTYFPDTVSFYYWSSTTAEYYARSAVGMGFGSHTGISGIFSAKENTYYVRAVRGGQSGSSGNLVVTPLSQVVTKEAGSAIFSVSNTGTGIMPWTAAITEGGDWLSISSGDRGTDAGTITCAYTANTGSASRTGTIRVTVYGATGTPMDLTVIQEPPGIIGGLPLGNLEISPLSRTAAKEAGSTTFSVSNTGTGAMPWTAAVTSGGDWLSISSGSSGTNAGNITCAFTAYTGTTSRTGTIRVMALGATGSPMDVTVVQGADTTACTATIDGNYSLHIPLISHVDSAADTPSYLADLAYDNDPAFPASMLFRLTNTAIQSGIFTCKGSTLSDDLMIHIPDVLLPDGITRIWLELAYSESLSTKGNVYFHVSNHGFISK